MGREEGEMKERRERERGIGMKEEQMKESKERGIYEHTETGIRVD